MEKTVFDSIYIQEKYYMDVTTTIMDGTRKINTVSHTHPRLELSIVKEGSGKYYIGDQTYDMKKNDIFIINNLEYHGIEMQKNDHMMNMVIHFEPRLVWSGNSDFDARYLKIFFDRNKNFCHKLDQNNFATQKIKELFFEIDDEVASKLPEYQLLVKVKLLHILALLLRHYNYVAEEAQEEQSYELRIINKITDFVDHNYMSEIKLQELAEIAHMNPNYLSTFFKKYNGLTVTDYIIRQRISRSIEYLQGTDQTILEIAGICGFNNSANFNKMFKKVTGLTPTAYRHKN